MRKCTSCGRYTLRDVCPACGSPTRSAHPPPFSEGSPRLEVLVRALIEGRRRPNQGGS
ncbi:MAG: RNA-protein complex protein Nop10 [Nitrososphaerota archaeon]|nr:RNA-protein complex protein Nop10 [Candidatus Calditenuis fumarioli]